MPNLVHQGGSSFGRPDPYLNPQEQLVKEYLGLALKEFSGSVLGTRTLRRFATETPSLFCSAGLSIILKAEQSPGIRYLASLLLKQDHLMRIVSDRLRFDKGDAISVFRQLLTFDPGLDIQMAKSLSNRESRQPEAEVGEANAERALDILDATSNGRRIVLILNHLVDHPDPRISSKAMLVVGKRMQSVEWAEKQILNQDDPRKRANAIETIWGINTDKAKNIMAHNAHDPNNRVVGNSAFGLHVVGDPRALTMVKRMAHENDPSFRWTAAWVMGQIGDPSFLGPLNDLVKDDDLTVKKSSLKSLVKIRREQMRIEAAKPKIVTEESATQKQLEKVQELEREIVPVVQMPTFNINLDGKHFSSGRRR